MFSLLILSNKGISSLSIFSILAVLAVWLSEVDTGGLSLDVHTVCNEGTVTLPAFDIFTIVCRTSDDTSGDTEVEVVATDLGPVTLNSLLASSNGNLGDNCNNSDEVEEYTGDGNSGDNVDGEDDEYIEDEDGDSDGDNGVDSDESHKESNVLQNGGV